MEYISTRNKNLNFGFKDVFLRGLAPDGGLFIPKKIKKYSQSELREMAKLNYIDLATKIVLEFCRNDLQEKELKNIIRKSYSSFSRNHLLKDFIPIKKTPFYLENYSKHQDEDIKISITIAELYHGPTSSFKDFAMQPIGRIYEHFLKSDNKKINIIVATSGDTGSAAIAALKDKSNINVFVLHPDNKISNIQRRLMTTVDSKNVYNLAIKGSFDDCQRLVKDMFADKKFSERINMSAVNSINWARIMFQIVYYFFIGLKVFPSTHRDDGITFSVPTGNFGNVYAGYISKKMGLPIKKLIIATNKNDILDKVIDSGEYRPSKTKPSISPSMDIQTASNFERLLYDVVDEEDEKVRSLMDKLKNEGSYSLNENLLSKIYRDFSSYSTSDKETKEQMKYYMEMYHYHIDPHTATASAALEDKLNSIDDYSGEEFWDHFILATADPYKFSETVQNVTGVNPKIPESIKNILNKKENYATLDNNIDVVKNYILEKVNES